MIFGIVKTNVSGMCGKYKLVKSSQVLIHLATFTFYAIIYTNANKQSLALMEGGRMEKIFFTVTEPVDEKHLETFRRIAKDLKAEHKCDVIVRTVNGIVLHTEVYYVSEKETEGRELDERQIKLDI